MVVQLVVLPVDQLTAGTDRFRCVPYRAAMPADACLRRQAAAAKQAGQGYLTSMFDRLTGDYRHCHGCQLGRAVKNQLQPDQEPSP